MSRYEIMHHTEIVRTHIVKCNSCKNDDETVDMCGLRDDTAIVDTMKKRIVGWFDVSCRSGGMMGVVSELNALTEELDLLKICGDKK